MARSAPVIPGLLPGHPGPLSQHLLIQNLLPIILPTIDYATRLKIMPSNKL